VSQVLVFLVAFTAMEGVSYGAHRWLMHSHRGMAWHASHHAPSTGRFERNDLFPLCFSVLGFAMFALAAIGAVPGWVWWAAAGITTYGVAYMAVHELFIHRRIPTPLPRWRYLDWLRRSHAAHHRDGGEPYGMLLPVMSAERRRAVGCDEALADRLLRSKQRSTRARL
jgi:beta-carotene 3-hydroxylase